MGCASSCVHHTTMFLFGKHSNVEENSKGRLERKLYIAKESPDPIFDLSDCGIKQIPSGIYSLCKVFRKEHLYLNNNKLTSLDDGGQLADLYLITVLNLSFNNIYRLPGDLKYLVGLKELYLQNNYLKNVPDSIRSLQNLEVFDISNNRLINLTASIGKLVNLRKLIITGNSDMTQLCPELCYAYNIVDIQLNAEQFVYPPPEITVGGTEIIMKFLCAALNVDYKSPSKIDFSSSDVCQNVVNPFERRPTISWEEQETGIVEQSRLHTAAKLQREKLLNEVLQDQQQLDEEVNKLYDNREIDRQRLISAIQEDEKEIFSLIDNFIKSDELKPDIKNQKLAYEEAEHAKLLEIIQQNYDNIKKSDILKTMENFINEDYQIQASKKHHKDYLDNIKENLIMQELEGSYKFQDIIKIKDKSHKELVQQLLEDQDIQKAMVASLLERVDTNSWSLNQEISLISSHLARLSVIEQEKKKLLLSYDYNNLLHQRMQLVFLLDDLLDQKQKRRNQLKETLREMEDKNKTGTSDFWLKNYKKLIDSAPKSLLHIGKNLDPILANCLLQEGAIHCLPFLVKFLFSNTLLMNVSSEDLKANGVSLSSDCEGVLRAIRRYIEQKNVDNSGTYSMQPSAPKYVDEENNCIGVTSKTEDVHTSECVVCMDEKCEVVFVPCAHMCCCYNCSDLNICPMCRSVIERKIKVIVA